MLYEVITDDELPLVTLSQSSTEISEVGGIDTITATLSNVFTSDVIVVIGSNATSVASSSDYYFSSDTILIPANSTSNSVYVYAEFDCLQEGDA